MLFWFVVSFVICVLVYFKKDCVNFNKFTFKEFIRSEILFLILISFLFSILLTLVSSIVIAIKCSAETRETETNIVALKDTVRIEGERFLFYSATNDEYKYRFVVDTDKGRMVKELDGSDEEVYIKEGDYNPKLVKTSQYLVVPKYAYHFAYRNLLDDSYSSYFTFYLPKGSMVVDEYNIDLE